MAALQPVPGQILLTQAKIEALRSAARETAGGTSSDSFQTARMVVDSVLATLNQQRCGDPAGVIRRSNNGSIAVREQREDGSLHWNVTYLDDNDDIPTSDTIKGWPCIHAESWRGRLTEADYPKPQPEKKTGA